MQGWREPVLPKPVIPPAAIPQVVLISGSPAARLLSPPARSLSPTRGVSTARSLSPMRQRAAPLLYPQPQQFVAYSPCASAAFQGVPVLGAPVRAAPPAGTPERAACTAPAAPAAGDMPKAAKDFTTEERRIEEAIQRCKERLDHVRYDARLAKLREDLEQSLQDTEKDFLRNCSKRSLSHEEEKTVRWGIVNEELGKIAQSLSQGLQERSSSSMTPSSEGLTENGASAATTASASTSQAPAMSDVTFSGRVAPGAADAPAAMKVETPSEPPGAGSSVRALVQELAEMHASLQSLPAPLGQAPLRSFSSCSGKDLRGELDIEIRQAGALSLPATWAGSLSPAPGVATGIEAQGPAWASDRQQEEEQAWHAKQNELEDALVVALGQQPDPPSQLGVTQHQLEDALVAALGPEPAAPSSQQPVDARSSLGTRMSSASSNKSEIWDMHALESDDDCGGSSNGPSGRANLETRTANAPTDARHSTASTVSSGLAKKARPLSRQVTFIEQQDQE
eukprot:TRINITY_DN110067_c0_g1_i1.p1 TRINITY_DN110067_c0_g1~~TRINITY_DN110067_c0_g1_i1.p1  ORF type:complete len:509 (+),score=115.57 TRINITY_DN110067_c0_g1_i1:99-1625(+)